jgi:hypothetical protein
LQKRRILDIEFKAGVLGALAKSIDVFVQSLDVLAQLVDLLA